YAICMTIVLTNDPSAQAPPPTDDVRSHLGLDPAATLVVYVESVTMDRGLELCVDALPLLPEVHLANVGPRYEPIEMEMLRRAERHGLTDRVHLVDAVPSAEVIPFISTASCSVIPIQNVCLSYYYCFPNKLLESVLAGLPIAAARLVEVEQFVSRFGVGIVMDERSAVGIAAGIRKLMADRGAYVPSAETIERISREYGWPVQEHRLTNVYNAIAEAA